MRAMKSGFINLIGIDFTQIIWGGGRGKVRVLCG